MIADKIDAVLMLRTVALCKRPAQRDVQNDRPHTPERLAQFTRRGAWSELLLPEPLGEGRTEAPCRGLVPAAGVQLGA